MSVAAGQGIERRPPRRTDRRASFSQRVRLLGGVAAAMLFHQRLKLAGTLFGVVFAVVLSNQQLGTFLGLLQKNTMLVDNTQADIWILPAGSETLVPGRTLSTSALDAARVTPGVAMAVPLLHTGATVQLPSGGTEAITLVAAAAPAFVGGPWNVVGGDVASLAGPGAMFFEDSQRDTLGGLNLGSVREVNGRKITVAGFTWGLIPFGPPYAFADYELGRELTRIPRDQTNAVLVRLAAGGDVDRSFAAVFNSGGEVAGQRGAHAGGVPGADGHGFLSPRGVATGQRGRLAEHAVRGGRDEVAAGARRGTQPDCDGVEE